MEVPPGARRCPNCSAAVGPQDPCPHCRAQAGISPDRHYRWVCDVCGGPRVPRLDTSIDYGGREAAPLRKADAARKARAGWRGAALATGLAMPFVMLVFGVLMLILGFSFTLFAVATMSMAPLVAFLVFALGRAGTRGREIAPALDAAWLMAASAIARQSPGAVTAASLSQKLGIEEPQAEELMALLDVNEALAGPSRVRIGPPSGALATQPTQLAEVPGAAATQPTHRVAGAAATQPTHLAPSAGAAGAAATQLSQAAGAAATQPTQVAQAVSAEQVAGAAAEQEAALLEQAAAEASLRQRKGSL